MRTIDHCHYQTALLQSLYPSSCYVFIRMAKRLTEEEGRNAEKREASTMQRGKRKAGWGNS